MPTRQGSPTTTEGDYLRNVRSTFAVPPPQSSSHDHSVHPSDLYSRPQPPSDVASNFEWSEDAASTIAPDDSVSQLDRRFTGRRGLFGPRPMDARDVPPAVPEMPEDVALEEIVHRDYVPPELLRDDTSTVVPTDHQSKSRGGGRGPAANRSQAGGMHDASAVGPLARARGETTSATTVPYSARQYEDEDEDAPLVSSRDAPRRTNDQSSHGSQSTVHPYSRPKGYAAVSGGGLHGQSDHDNDDDDNSYYPKRGDDAERGGDSRYSGGDQEMGIKAVESSGTGLVGSLMSRLRGNGGASRRQESSFYAPNELAFEPPVGERNSSYPPTSYGMDRSQSSGLYKIPSLDVAGPHDRTASEKYVDPSTIRPAPLWKRWFWDTTDPARREWEHKRSIGIQRWPYASWALAVVMTIVSVFFFLLARRSLVGADSNNDSPTGHDRRARQDEVYHGFSHSDETCVQLHDRRVAAPRMCCTKSLVLNLWILRFDRPIRCCLDQPGRSVRRLHEVYSRRMSLARPLVAGGNDASLIKRTSIRSCQVTDIQWTCLNQTNSATLSSSDPTCTMSDICGFGGFAIVDGARGPDQSFRFFVPIFLHAGIVHLLVNLAVQCFGSTAQVSLSVEKIPLLLRDAHSWSNVSTSRSSG